jgi:glycosyltransferase involved in cell wall biosynthesis
MNARKLTIYGNCWNQASAGQYYRIRVPLRAMEAQGLARTFTDTPFQDNQQREEFMFSGDVQIHFLTGGKGIHLQTQKFTELKPAHNRFMEMQYPPIVIFDMDDDIESINPLNPKFCTLGTRDADGKLLMPEDEIGIMFDDPNRVIDPLAQPMPHPMEIGYSSRDESARPVYLWKRGAVTPNGTFDVGRNIVQHAQVRKMAATAHAITVSSEELAKHAAAWNERVYVYPNSLLFDDNVRFDIRRGSDDVRVLWQGGYSHFPDFYPLRSAITECSRRLPQVKYVVFGTLFSWIYEKIAPGRIEHHKWEPFELFHMKYGTLSADINLAPLADNRFNQCKSGIKWYEAAALGIPTLAQNTGPYREIEDGVTGLLFSDEREFISKLEWLVKDADFRRKLGAAACDWVHEHRDALKNVKKLVDFYHCLRSDVHGLKRAA